MKWQPIETAPRNCNVILYAPGLVGEGRCDGLSGNWYWEGYDEPINPTHWMPLPEPPK